MNAKIMAKWCKDNKGEMDLYGKLMKDSLVDIFKLIDKQNHSGGSICVLRRNLILFLVNDKKSLRKLGFKRKLKTWKWGD